jgi:apolipoprotein D and lipocalin family protein
MKKVTNFLIPAIMLIFLLCSCAGIPRGVIAVNSFESQRYLGKWYEIARFDFKFEKNLNNTTAEYSMNTDGSIRVKNRGLNYVTGEWQEAIGKAKFRGDPSVAELEVSFFGPFYAGYNVIALDPEYRYALVAGQNFSYLWILSRTPTIPEDVRMEYITLAESLGFNVADFIWVEHSEQ